MQPVVGFRVEVGEAVDLRLREHGYGARVISLSLGGPQTPGFDPVERDAIEYAVNNNVTVVAAEKITVVVAAPARLTPRGLGVSELPRLASAPVAGTIREM